MNNAIIIQFSTRYAPWEQVAFGDELNRDRWFKFRANLFNNALLKCLCNQTKAPDKVYLLLDEHDTSLYDEYLKHDILTPIYHGSHNEAYTKQIIKDIRQNNLHTNIAISRIDSDDLICKDYLKNINAQLDIYPKKLLVACKGYRSDLTQIQSTFCPVAAFMTQYNRPMKMPNFERLDSSREISIFDFSHVDIWQKDHYQVHSAEWIQLVHGRNIHNAFVVPTNYGADRSHTWESSYSPLLPIDADWFRNWAGFDLPDSSIINFEI